MTATDELRRLLDERGVDYVGTHQAFTAWWGDHDIYWSAMEVYDGELDLGTNMSNVFPEQAIAATLGSSNCTNGERTGTCIADETETISVRGDTRGYYFDKHFTIHVIECSECGHAYEHVNGDYEFCPHCGRRVVEVDE